MRLASFAPQTVFNVSCLSGFFIQGFPKLLRFQSHHDRILKKFLPKLKKHLDKNGIDTGIYTLKWFFQCFLDRVSIILAKRGSRIFLKLCCFQFFQIPFSLTLRIWDLYLLEGERILTSMAYNILRMHRRYLMKLNMDELIEHLQINLEKDFGYDDDVAIEKLKEVLSELGSNRLDTAGRAPTDELAQRPFGMVQHLTMEKEAGTRTGLTEKEREFSTHTIQKQIEVESRLRREHSTVEEDEEEGKFENFLASSGHKI
jgi:hypothetical protein